MRKSPIYTFFLFLAISNIINDLAIDPGYNLESI